MKDINLQIKNILYLTKKLIKIPSTKDNPKALLEILSVVKKELKDFKIQEFYSNKVPSLLIYNKLPKSKKFKIILNGHLDVVPAKKEQFKPIIKGNKLYGRGAHDMKSALAVKILTFKEIAKNLNYPIALQIVTDEEVGGYNGTKYQLKKGIKADFVIIGEPTNLNIGQEAKGLLWIKLKTFGKSAHSAYPWKGENPIESMVKNIQAIYKLFKKPKKETWQTTCNISIIKAGKTINKIPKECQCILDIRRNPKDRPKDIIKILKSTLKKGTELEILLNEPSHKKIPRGEQYIKNIQKLLKKHQVKNSKIVKMNGASDCRHFSLKDIPSIEFGPKGEGSHTEEEWVDIESLNTYKQLLKDFLYSLN